MEIYLNLDNLYLLYFLIGILFCISEIFTLTFYLLPLGIASFLTGLCALYFQSIYVHAFCFGIISVLSIFLMQKFRTSKFLKSTEPHYHSGPIGSQGVVISVDKINHTVKVKIFGDIWDVYLDQNHVIELQEEDTVKVIGTSGNKIIVKKI